MTSIVSFQPIVIEGQSYTFAHDSTYDDLTVWCASGDYADVYRISNGSQCYAIKIFRERQIAESISYFKKISCTLNEISDSQVFRAANQTILDRSEHQQTIEQQPELHGAILCPWIEGKTWYEIMKTHTYTLYDGLTLAYSLCMNILRLENLGYAHRDLNSKNLLLSDDKLFLIDFDTFYIGHELERPVQLETGTPGYARLGCGIDLFSPCVDKFSASILLMELIISGNSSLHSLLQGNKGKLFSSRDIQSGRHSELYKHISQKVAHGISKRLASIFDESWLANDICNCPSMNEWIQVLKGL